MVYEAWNKGRVDIEPVGNGAIRYCLSYIDKQVFGADALYEYYGDFQPPFALFSKGIGATWIKQNLNKFDEYGKITFNNSGKSYTLNPYYRRKYNFKLKPYITPFSDSVVKYAQEHHLSLPDALKQRCKIKELYYQHKQIKNREPLYQCSKYILQKAFQRAKDLGLDVDPRVSAYYTKSLLKPDDELLNYSSVYDISGVPLKSDRGSTYKAFHYSISQIHALQSRYKIRN